MHAFVKIICATNIKYKTFITKDEVDNVIDEAVIIPCDGERLVTNMKIMTRMTMIYDRTIMAWEETFFPFIEEI